MTEKRWVAAAVFLFFTIISICILLNESLDGYFLWIRIGGSNLLVVYWQKRHLYTLLLPFYPSYSLWIPLIPLSIVIAYLVVVERKFNFKTSLRGWRMHHYHVGFLALGVAAFLAFVPSIVGELSTSFLLGWKKTSVAEIMFGLSFTLFLGGTTFMLLDIRDMVLALSNRFARRPIRVNS